jgi:hypothetical protein
VYLDDILAAAAKIRRYIAGVDRETFVHDDKTVDAVVRNLEVIGEATKRAMHEIEETVSDTPFRMPIAVVEAQARLGGPLRLGVRAGASLATTLRGCYETALLRAGCAVSSGPRCCERTPADEPGAVVCARPEACPIPGLYKPRSEAQRRDHASPIGLWARQTAERLLDVRMVLWGRRALAARALAFEALVAAGRAGLWDDRASVLFDVTYKPVFEGALGAWAAQATATDRVLVELASPCQGGDAQLAHLLGNLAHDLVQWDLEDSGDSTRLGKRGCDTLADEARREAEASLAGVTVDVRALDAEDHGLRQSRSNRGSFRLYGVSGYVELSGDLTRAWPWLASLALRGAGQKRSFGLGEVRLWLAPSAR